MPFLDFPNRNKMPQKPQRQKDQVDMLWDAVFNHLPSKLNWIDIEIKFVFLLLVVILAILGVK